MLSIQISFSIFVPEVFEVKESKDMIGHSLPFKKSFVRTALLVLLLAAAVTPVLGQQDPMATLDPIQGLVQYRAAGAPDNAWITLTRVQLVSEGDWVRTDALGMAYLTFFEGVELEILPDTLVQVTRLQAVDADSPNITLQMSIGSMQTQIDHVLDASSRYEVQTPSAVVAVRGTEFWVTSTWLSESFVDVLTGRLEVAGVSEDGQLSLPVVVEAEQSVDVFPLGIVGPAQPLDPATLPQYPPQAPLAPATCGNLVCDAGETESNCALDCTVLTTCGNAICERDLSESPITCAADCVPRFRRQDIVMEVIPSTATSVPLPTALPTVAQPCTVQTSSSSVAIYVGPGLYRAIRSMLLPNVPIPVVGKLVDGQGQLWWNIQPPDFDPAEADRYWVLADEVNEFGNCDAVPDAAPSLLVPPRPTRLPQDQPPDQQSTTPMPPPSGEPVISFYASKTAITDKECVSIGWDVENIREVYYQNVGVTGHDTRVECPTTTTSYTLFVVLLDGTSTSRTITITVSGSMVY